jgi:hypothetical protein
MKPATTTIVAIAVTAIAAAALATAARADSVGGRPDERSSIQHAESVVVGAFTGRTARRVREQRNAIDAHGRAYTARIELVAHDFAVGEHLDGAPTPPTISILVPGALALPAPQRRVVLGIRAEGAAPEDGYNLLYGRALEADTDARLAELRDWVKDVRAPAPVHPQAVAEALGAREAELRPDDPVPGEPIGADDPAGPARPSFVGPPRTAPRVIEPLGDPRHPPEPAAVAAAGDAGGAGGAAPWIAPVGRRATPSAAIGAAGEPPARAPRPRWPFAAAAALVLVAGALRWRRAVHARPR